MVKKMKKRTTVVIKILASIVLFVLSVLVFSMSIYYFEKDAQPEFFDSFSSAIVYVLLNLTTVGYSQMVPMTPGGQIITVLLLAISYIIGIACLIWIVLRIITFQPRKILQKNTGLIKNSD